MQIWDCILYRGLEHLPGGEILGRMEELRGFLHLPKEKQKEERANARRTFFGCVGDLLSMAAAYGFTGNLWQAYLTFLLVDRRHRGKGAGTALFSAFAESMRSAGADSVRIANGSPVQLDWRIPGTPGHDHNNMPGLDTGCAGAGFFARAGFMETGREVSMYRALEGYASPPEAGRFRERLAGEGIYT